MIAPEDIEKIKAVSLVEAIGKEIELKKNGSEYKGLTPFGKEKTPSFTVNESKKIWKCFHSGKGGKSAVDFYMALDDHFGGGGKWLDACKKVAQVMNIPLNGVYIQEAAKPTFNKRPLKEDEVPGTRDFKYKDFTEDELKVIGPRVNAEHCQHFHLHSCEMMTIVKENEAIEISSTPDFPIFVFDFGTWQKIYQPKAQDKAMRFTYAGKKPAKFIHGMAQIKAKFEARKKEIQNDEFATGDEDPRLDDAFILSGGSDAINIYSFFKDPIFLNSETEHLEWEDYKQLTAMVKNLYYLGDLDATGIREAIKIGLKFLDIKLIWLPESLRKFNDRRGNPCKDLKDYVSKFYNSEKPQVFQNTLNKLIENSLPFQFWTGYFSTTSKKMEYYISNTKLYHFLKHLGFGRYEHPNLKDGYIYIRKEGSIVRVLEPYQIANFIHQFLEERQMPIELRDYAYKSPALAEKSLSNLPKLEIDFTIADKYTQHFVFQNKIWKITKDGIETFAQGQVDKYIWEDKVIDFRPELNPEPFTITKDKDGDLDVTINQTDNIFMNYLINGSRIHWRKDLEDSFIGKPVAEEIAYYEKNKFNLAGENLTPDEILEQKLHFINKTFAIGYLLHQYKNESKAWCIFAMDNKISDQGESHGGSGKSLGFMNMVHMLKRRVYIKGRDPKITENQFIYSAVTEDSDYIIVDDADFYLNLNFFFSEITGSLVVNPKNNKQFEIPFDKAPKFVITSNFTPRNIDPSVLRRLLYVVFSDYYHFNKDNTYKQARQVSDDFEGRNMFTDFTDKEWNDFYNYCAYACRFFLSWPYKIDPPMNNVTKRNLITQMGPIFKDWADDFFSQTEKPVGSEEEKYKYLNQFFSKDEANQNYVAKHHPKNWTSQKFKNALKAYCEYNEWIFNPVEVGVKDGRIMKKWQGETQEVIYIKTFNDSIIEADVEVAMDFNVTYEIPEEDNF